MKKNNFGSSSVANFIAMIALILSIVASFFSYNVYRNNRKELISISTKRIQDGYLVNIDTMNINWVSIPTLWECIITNNGQQTVSLIDKQIKQVNFDGVLIYDSGLDLRLMKDNKSFSFPINISPGESVKFYMKVKVLMNSKAVRVLVKKADKLNDLTLRKIQYFLAKDSIDVFGNKIDPIFQDDKLIFSLPRVYNQTRYQVDLKTGRGKIINAKLSWYPEFNIE
ncbi:hypothetical protein [uncultured Bacteroides sp.]|uniref:hypothetical protein n=1 Tax=uncultured Bacteroides sp. TaxID=162156 RepID=UPI002AAB1749|nr:hypothetical protein [uncultured Bacteroides sp.]